MKGELDDAVEKLGFKNLTILRPSALIGKRKAKRSFEFISTSIISLFTKIIFKNYRPINDVIVAQAMINAATSPNLDKIIWEGDEVFKLAEK